MSYATLTALLACASLPVAAAPFVRDDIITRPTPEAFRVCQDQGCRTLSTQSPDNKQWHWFEANGEPPYIVPLEQWRRGWKPGRP